MTVSGWTIALQILNFLVLVWLLQRFLYRPARAVITARREQQRRLLEEARASEERARTMQAELAARLAELEQRERTLRAEIEKGMQAEREQLLGKAREEAAQIVESARKALAEERRRTLERLRGELADLAVDLTRRLLEPLRGPALDEVFFERLLAHLQGLSEDDRHALAAAGGSATPIVLTTASALDENRRSGWRRRLQQALGELPRLEFRSDETLLAGVELACAHRRIVYHLRDQLDHARSRILPKNPRG